MGISSQQPKYTAHQLWPSSVRDIEEQTNETRWQIPGLERLEHFDKGNIIFKNTVNRQEILKLIINI